MWWGSTLYFSGCILHCHSIISWIIFYPLILNIIAISFTKLCIWISFQTVLWDYWSLNQLIFVLVLRLFNYSRFICFGVLKSKSSFIIRFFFFPPNVSCFLFRTLEQWEAGLLVEIHVGRGTLKSLTLSLTAVLSLPFDWYWLFVNRKGLNWVNRQHCFHTVLMEVSGQRDLNVTCWG